MPRCLPSWTPYLERFLLDFCSQLGPPEPNLALAGSLQMRFFVFSEKSIFDPILVPTWLDFGTQNPPKSTQRSIPRGIKKLMHFCIDFQLIFDRFWRPTWSHVGHFFAQNTATANAPRVFLLGPSFFSVFGASWPPLGALWARFGRVRASILEVFGAHFLHNFQIFCTHFFNNLSLMLKHLLH